MIYVGFDFSCNKTAMSILDKNGLNFFFYPLELDKISIDKLTDSKILVRNRKRLELSKDATSSEKFRWHVSMAKILCDFIKFDLTSCIDIVDQNDVRIAFEGSSFGSSGDAGLQLAGYRYILVNELARIYGMNNIYTYAPLTIKSVAGCASKDKKGKDSMINAFREKNVDHQLNSFLKNNPEFLKKKTNFVPGIDDLVDSYWVLETMRIKENI